MTVFFTNAANNIIHRLFFYLALHWLGARRSRHFVPFRLLYRRTEVWEVGHDCTPSRPASPLSVPAFKGASSPIFGTRPIKMSADPTHRARDPAQMSHGLHVEKEEETFGMNPILSQHPHRVGRRFVTAGKGREERACGSKHCFRARPGRVWGSAWEGAS